jgi:hypothetical protein
MAYNKDLRVGDQVAFRRSSGAVTYGTVSHLHHLTGEVTVTWCDKMLYKTLSMDDVSTSALPFAVGARRSTGRKRRTGKHQRRTGKPAHPRKAAARKAGT